MTFECSVCAGHGDDFSFLHQEVLGAVQSTPQELKGPELLSDENEGSDTDFKNCSLWYFKKWV